MKTATELPIVVIDGHAFEAVEFLSLREDWVNGHELDRRIESMSNLADRSDVDLFLIRQRFIPGAWRQIIPIFARKIKCGRFGYRGFYHLCWCEHLQRWYLDARWIGWGFGKDCRLVRRVPALTVDAEHLAFPSP